MLFYYHYYYYFVMMMMMMMCFSWLRNGDDYDDDVDEVPKTWWLFRIPPVLTASDNNTLTSTKLRSSSA